jgi:hypothetical protein
LLEIPGTTLSIISSGIQAFQQTYADSIRLAYVVAVPFVFVGTILCWWLSDLKSDMTYYVDAPVDMLSAKVDHGKENSAA